MKLNTKSLVSRAWMRFLVVGPVCFIGAIVLAMLVDKLAETIGIDSASAGIFGAVMWLVFLFLGYRFVILPSLARIKSIAPDLLKGSDAAIRAGQYAEALAIADKAMQELPTWETLLPGAGIYALAGRLDRAEQIVQRLLSGITLRPSDTAQSVTRLITIQGLALLTDIYIMQGRLDMAKKSAERMLSITVNITIPPTLNTLSRLYLLLGEPDRAEVYIALTGNIPLRAWLLAMRGKSDESAELLKQAFAHADQNDRLNFSDLYLVQGYAERALGHKEAAKNAFENALRIDLNGANGLIAQREIAKIEANR